MYFIGNNKFPCKQLCCCMGSKASKRSADLQVLMTCGPESGKVALTFMLMNVPLIMFLVLTFNFFYKDAYNFSHNDIWRILIFCHAGLIVLTNIFFFVAASTDPGIIPARNWTSCKQDIARRYKQTDKNYKIFYHAVNM